MKQILLLLTAGLLSIMQSYAQTAAIYNNGAHIISTNGSYWVVGNGSIALSSASADNPTQLANLNITASGSFVLPPNSYLTVNGTLANNSGTDGLVLQSNASGSASLIHASGNVDATQQRYLSGSASLTAMTYHLVSVPLTPATASVTDLFTGAYLYDFNVLLNAWNGLGTSSTTPLDETRGYMIYVPQASHTYTFSGPMNSGEFTTLTTHGGSGYNLVPNPYPSAIDWDAASGWTKTDINNALYIWPSGGNNYASYVDGVENNGGSRYIPSGQSFFVKSSASSPILAMTNDVRVHSSQPFYKNGNWIPDLLRIRATANGMADEAVVRFTSYATAFADGDYDAWKIPGTEGAPQLSTLSSDNHSLSINSLPYEQTAYIVPMDFAMAASGQVALFFNSESFAPTVTIHLRDELTNTTTNLRSQNTYIFQHVQGAGANRFKILFGGAIGTSEPAISPVRQWISGHTLYISAPTLAGQQADVTVYNIMGQTIQHQQMTLEELTTLTLKGIPGTMVVVTKMVNSGAVLITKGIVLQ